MEGHYSASDMGLKVGKHRFGNKKQNTSRLETCSTQDRDRQVGKPAPRNESTHHSVDGGGAVRVVAAAAGAQLPAGDAPASVPSLDRGVRYRAAGEAIHRFRGSTTANLPGSCYSSRRGVVWTDARVCCSHAPTYVRDCMSPHGPCVQGRGREYSGRCKRALVVGGSEREQCRASRRRTRSVSGG